MTRSETRTIIQCLEFRNFEVENWKPGNKRIFKVLTKDGHAVSGGMFSEELRAWYRGYLHGLKSSGRNQAVARSTERCW